MIATLLNEENVAVVPVTSVEVEVARSEATLAPGFSILLVKCQMKRLGRSAQG